MILEALREPLEDYKILISRVHSKVVYPTKFMFIGAMNPCPCGNLLSQSKECRCNEKEILNYKNRLSDPFYDRIDLFVTMNEVHHEDKADVTSQQLHHFVIKAFHQQMHRKQSNLNGKLSDEELQQFCILTKEAQELLQQACLKLQLSFRAQNKVIKVARTIADMYEKEFIEKSHIIEALGYRKR
jgi:magnesium chelatase family protein